MKGAGELGFEYDYPPGSDIIGEIMHGPRAAERMEVELFSQLAAYCFSLRRVWFVYYMYGKGLLRVW